MKQFDMWNENENVSLGIIVHYYCDHALQSRDYSLSYENNQKPKHFYKSQSFLWTIHVLT